MDPIVFLNYILSLFPIVYNLDVDCFGVFLFFKIFIEVQLIYNAVLVSGVHQSESVIHIHISTSCCFF